MATKLTTLKPRVAELKPALKEATGSWRSSKTTNQRGYTYRWQKEREQFLRENPLCCYCYREGRIAAASVVDHKIPHQGDDLLFWDRSNRQPLCKKCHDSTKAREERGSRS